MSHVLERVGFKVEVAVHGLEALEKMSGRKFNLIITDLEMPVMHGYELIAELKRSPKTAKLPVVVLTSQQARSTVKSAGDGRAGLHRQAVR